MTSDHHAPAARRGRSTRATAHASGAERVRAPRDTRDDADGQGTAMRATFQRARARGIEAGPPEDHWFEAEAELRGRAESADIQAEGTPTQGGDATDIE